MDQLGLNDAVGVGSLVNYLDGINADVAAECLGVMLAIALSMLNNGVAISDGDLLNLKGAILRIIGYKGSKCTVDGGWVHQGFQFFTENGQAVRYQGIWLDIVMPVCCIFGDPFFFTPPSSLATDAPPRPCRDQAHDPARSRLYGPQARH